MSEHGLRHLAFVDCTAPRGAGIGEAVRNSCAAAAAASREAFAVVPGLQAFSWLCPPLDRALAQASLPDASRACAEGLDALGAVAKQLGAALRLCGRVEGLGLTREGTPSPEASRTLLWYLRYGGRDEILRAAERFQGANPGAPLGDGQLDAWLDTAGVPDPDLLVFVGGPPEPHDVLLWQGSYAELWHAPARGDDFPAGEVRRAVGDFRQRQRRFGR